MSKLHQRVSQRAYAIEIHHTCMQDKFIFMHRDYICITKLGLAKVRSNRELDVDWCVRN